MTRPAFYSSFIAITFECFSISAYGLHCCVAVVVVVAVGAIVVVAVIVFFVF